MATRLRERGGRVRTGPTLQTPPCRRSQDSRPSHPLTTVTSARRGDTRIARESTREYGPDATTEGLDFEPRQATLLAFPANVNQREPPTGKNISSSFQLIDQQHFCASPVLLVTTALPISQHQLRRPSRRGSMSRLLPRMQPSHVFERS